MLDKRDADMVFNKAIIEQRFSRAVKTYDSQARAQGIICRNMLHLLQQQGCDGAERILEFGAGTGIMTRLIVDNLSPREMIVNDLCHNMQPCYAGLEERSNISYLWGDAETIAFPKGNDVVVGCSCIQWFTNIYSFIDKCHNIINDNGVLAISTFSPDNMREFKEITGNGLEYTPLNELRDILEREFDIIHLSQEDIKIEFDTPYDILRHLKQTGVTGTCQQPWTKGRVQDFCQEYVKRFSSPHGVELSYSPIYIIARKRV